MNNEKNDIEYLFIDKESELYDQAVELRYKEFFEQFNRPKESLFDEVEDKSIQIVACLQGKVVGHARLFIENSIGEISQVVVDKEYRGMKIGFGLITTLLDFASKENIKLMGLDSRVHAINFYRKLGFTTLGDIFPSWKTGLPHIRMIKEF